jgi:FkbM family methyltransferase
MLREFRMLRDARNCPPSSDPLVDETIALWARPGMVAVDAGAHQGLWTFRLARAVGRSGHVFAFEPSPEYVPSLLRVIERAGLSNVTVLPIALGDEDGKTGFRTHDETGKRLTGESRLSTSNESANAEVEIARLDSLVARYPRLAETDLIKVDVEGAERTLFVGAEGLLRRRHPRIYAEIEDRHCQRFGWTRQDVLDLLATHGYRATPVNPVDFRLDSR